jgi:hypothetical protein
MMQGQQYIKYKENINSTFVNTRKFNNNDMII